MNKILFAGAVLAVIATIAVRNSHQKNLPPPADDTVTNEEQELGIGV